MGDGPSNPEGNIRRSVKPWGEAMYQVARSELARAAEDPDYLDPDREQHLKAGIERYEAKRRRTIEGVLQRLNDSMEAGDEQGVKDLREWLDGKNKDGVSNAKSSEVFDLMQKRTQAEKNNNQQTPSLEVSKSIMVDPTKEASLETRQTLQQVARRGLVFPGPPPSKR